MDDQWSNVTHALNHDHVSNINPRLANGVIVVLLLLLNLAGNSLVFYVYKYLIKRNLFSFFVTTLAALDLLSAVTTMQMDAIMKMRPLDETSLSLVALCKLTHFQVYANHLISGCVLILIAYTRYTKICKPLHEGMTMRKAKITVLFLSVGCILLSTFTLVVNGPQEVQIQMGDHVVNVTICRYDKDYEGKPIQQVFVYILTSAFAIVLVATVIFYVMISRALSRFERRSSLKSAGLHSPTVDENSDPSSATHSRPRVTLRERISEIFTGSSGEKISIHMYKMFTIVTFVFVVSYLPHLVVLILLKVLNLDHMTLTYGQRFALELAYNGPYLSCVLNPVIYGFRSAEFRKHCRHVLTCRNSRRSY
ncbi:neuropeptide FF receptor 1-like [Physella acuta]|uniref:neuropeptide FF receptor 1-like n=1 Tax=Physella acuta TaxID=109671 RepID=UPI0027DCDB8E|nr:neuropeptide FF receptor 1-like [Physella acuta]